MSDPLKGCSWRYIKRNMACLDPSHFIEDMFMGMDFPLLFLIAYRWYILWYSPWNISKTRKKKTSEFVMWISLGSLRITSKSKSSKVQSWSCGPAQISAGAPRVEDSHHGWMAIYAWNIYWEFTNRFNGQAWGQRIYYPLVMSNVAIEAMAQSK